MLRVTRLYTTLHLKLFAFNSKFPTMILFKMTKPRIVQFYKCGHRFHANLTLEQIALKRFLVREQFGKNAIIIDYNSL